MSGLLPLLAWLVVFALGALVIMLFVIALASSTVKQSVTDRFAAAEFIIKHQRPPSEWIRPPNLWQHLLNRNRSTQLLLSNADHVRLKKQIIRRLKGLIRYFEKSPFFEDEEARKALIHQLIDVLEAWNTKNLSEIINV
jgi:hypothetical protein